MKTHGLRCLHIQLKKKQLKIENLHFTEFALILLGSAVSIEKVCGHLKHYNLQRGVH